MHNSLCRRSATSSALPHIPSTAELARCYSARISVGRAEGIGCVLRENSRLGGYVEHNQMLEAGQGMSKRQGEALQSYTQAAGGPGGGRTPKPT